MTSTPTVPAGHVGVPVHQLEAIIDACGTDEASVVSYIEALLTDSIERGTEAFPALTLAEWLSESLAVNGVHASVTQVRRMLPPIMSRLFGSKLSCSVKDKDGRVVRGYRGLALRDVQQTAPVQP